MVASVVMKYFWQFFYATELERASLTDKREKLVCMRLSGCGMAFVDITSRPKWTSASRDAGGLNGVRTAVQPLVRLPA